MNDGHLVLWAIFAVAGAVVSWRALEFINRRPEFGAFALFLWLGGLVLAQDDPGFFDRNVGGVTITPADVLSTFLAAIAGLRFLRGLPSLKRYSGGALLVLGGVLLLSYARGVVEFGIQHATNEFREFFYFLSALFFAVSFPFGRLGRKVPLITVTGGALLMGIGIVHLGGSQRLDIDHRPLPSYAALAVGEAFFLGWFWVREIPRSRLWRWLVLSFLPFSFLMLHRSVWMCLLAGLAGLLALDQSGRKRLLAVLVLGVGLGTVTVSLFFQEQVAKGLNSAVNEATSSDDSTFIWRLEGWKALLAPESDLPIIDVLVGRPMGSGYARRLGDSVLNTEEIEAGVIPHNYYVSLFLRGGLVGLGAWLLLYGVLLKDLLAGFRRDPQDTAIASFLVILVVQLVYYVPYSADAIQGLLLGGAIVLTVSLRVPAVQPVFA